MVYQLEFNKTETDKVEKDFAKADVKASQQEYCGKYAKIYAKYLPLSEMALKGFMHFAIRNFEAQEGIDATSLGNMPTAEAMKYSRIMGEIFAEKLASVLLRQEQRKQLEVALKEVDRMMIAMYDALQ